MRLTVILTMDSGTHRELLKSVSRSFYLSMRFLPAGMREPISLGYLLARFSDTIADAPGLPLEERLSLLHWFLRSIQAGEFEPCPDLTRVSVILDHPGESRLVESVGALFPWYRSLSADYRDPLCEVISTIISGQVWDITAFAPGNVVACESGANLLGYAYEVAGCVGEFWTKTAYTALGDAFSAPGNGDDLLVRGRKLGQALQLTNILRDLYEDLPRGRCYLPADELRAAGWDGRGMPREEELRAPFEKWLSVCDDLLEESAVYLTLVRDPRVRFCTRLPHLLAGATVSKLRAAGVERVMQEKIKISRTDVWNAMGRALFFL